MITKENCSRESCEKTKFSIDDYVDRGLLFPGIALVFMMFLNIYTMV